MFLIGLTGGIAAGKTTVGDFWKTLGAHEIDADSLARNALDPGSDGFKQVLKLFGPGIQQADGTIDRSKLGAIVFQDATKRKELETIVHPIVREQARSLIEQQPNNAIVVYNVPLLVEADIDLPFNVVVTVEAPESVRISRLRESRGLSLTEAQARIQAQSSSAERANRADFILNSNQPLSLLLRDAQNLWNQFVKDAHGAD